MRAFNEVSLGFGQRHFVKPLLVRLSKVDCHLFYGSRDKEQFRANLLRKKGRCEILINHSSCAFVFTVAFIHYRDFSIFYDRLYYATYVNGAWSSLQEITDPNGALLNSDSDCALDGSQVGVPVIFPDGDTKKIAIPFWGVTQAGMYGIYIAVRPVSGGSWTLTVQKRSRRGLRATSLRVCRKPGAPERLKQQ